ncbi:hypothetical protein T484DRAFT_1770755 [Baffinella frigidus]|nr:hypothetical protein T484DRAFT_1770755 [Cryptophyta sp. CCMP2293]
MSGVLCKVLVMFLSPFAFAMAILICVAADNLDIGGEDPSILICVAVDNFDIGGVTWGHLFNEDLAGISVGFCFLALLWNIFFNLFLTWYLDKVVPRDNEVYEKDPFFFFKPSLPAGPIVALLVLTQPRV